MSVLRFSANVGFLWPELALPERIIAAGRAGFDAVECHFPYEYDSADVSAALELAGLPMLGLNTKLGLNGQDDFGVAARPDRVAEARQYIDEAIEYAVAIDCATINVVPGKTGRTPEAEATFRDNLRYACDKASAVGKIILIEPINTTAAPDFHCSYLGDALSTIQAVGANNLKVMVDCFHTQVMQGHLLENIKTALPYLGHIQISAVHDRGEPDVGEIDYGYLLSEIDKLGWSGYIGAEYKPRSSTEDGLQWLADYLIKRNTN